VFSLRKLSLLPRPALAFSYLRNPLRSYLTLSILVSLCTSIVFWILIYCLNPFLVLKQLNSGKVIAVGPGSRDKAGNLIPVSVKEGDHVLLPEYGGTQVKLEDKEYVYWIVHLLCICYVWVFCISRKIY
jgi:hypothetical protein